MQTQQYRLVDPKGVLADLVLTEITVENCRDLAARTDCVVYSRDLDDPIEARVPEKLLWHRETDEISKLGDFVREGGDYKLAQILHVSDYYGISNWLSYYVSRGWMIGGGDA